MITNVNSSKIVYSYEAPISQKKEATLDTVMKEAGKFEDYISGCKTKLDAQ